MISIKGYKTVEYAELQKMLFAAKQRLNKTYFQIASDIKATSIQTSVSALMVSKPKLSDQKLTKVMSVLGVNGFVLTAEGTKYYYIKQN